MIDHSKKLSIITINYNHGPGLQKTIDSVTGQSFVDYEYIIIDGGSTDSSVEIINNHAKQFAYWVSEKDRGVYDAMNKGILQAKGEYCYFLNSGDVLWNNKVLESLFSNNVEEDIVYGNMIHGGSETIEKGIADVRFYDFFVGSIYHQSAFIKTGLFKRVGLYDENYKVISDWIFFLQAIFLHRCSLRYVDLEIARYETGGLSFKDLEGNLKDRRDVLEKYFPRFIKDYDALAQIKQSDLVAIHRLIAKKNFISKFLSLGMGFSRFWRFSVMKQQKKENKFL
jgi:glycosyltransferase involved in cell wall biosynthesis